MSTPFEFLGPYRIGQQLGRGGMGAVYEAAHERTGEKVAVKLIAQHIAEEPRFRRRFDEEVKTLQRLRHQGIVRLIGFGEEDGHLFYSMELVEGESLQARIRREKKLNWRVVIDVSIQICSALKHAHDIGVIHRDLKPANLILTNDDTVKLVDFGIVKVFGISEHTAPGAVLGTADYMPPEQATGTATTQRTDLYALGCVMYAALTGRPPFTGKSVTEVIEALKRDRPVPLDLINPDLPEALVELVHQLLEKDPAKRPPTALAVMNRLKAMRAGLQREQTVMHDGSPTKVGPITSGTHDTSADVVQQSDSDSATAIPNAQTDVRKKRKTIVSKGAAASPAVNPNQVTVVSSGSDKTMRLDGSLAEDCDSDHLNTKTHFQTVGDSDSRSSVFLDSSTEQEPGWTQRLSIAGMVGVLIAGCALFMYASRPPTPDQLYAAALSGDSAARRAFMTHCPDDQRFNEIFNLDMAHELDRTLRRLSVKLTPLEGFEEAFINAMEGRDQDPERSMESIRQWLIVYDTQNNDDDNLKELIRLAKHEQTQLALRAPRIIVHPNAQKLIDEIQARVQHGEPEATRTYLIGIIETHGQDYGKDSWAKPAVDEARQQLQLLEQQADPVAEGDASGETSSD